MGERRRPLHGGPGMCAPPDASGTSSPPSLTFCGNAARKNVSKVCMSPQSFITAIRDTNCYRGKKSHPWETYLRIYHEMGYFGTQITQEGLGK